MMAIKNISKHYTDDYGFKLELFEDISFEVIENKITSIIAPSGTGKTSLLKIIAGLEKQTNGEIINNYESVIYIPSEPSSFPWLSTKENIIFGLKVKDNNDINEIIKLTGLEGYEEHYPQNKSLGYRFRIALARSLVRKPPFIIIDEPFNKMDGNTKYELYLLLLETLKSMNVTFLIATTNISEAIFLSNVVYIMHNNPGRIIEKIQIDLPENRDDKIFLSKEFVEYRLRIENAFKSTDKQKLVNVTI